MWRAVARFIPPVDDDPFTRRESACAALDAPYVGTMPETPSVTARHWSDWAGFAAFLSLAVWLAASAPALTVALVPVLAYELAMALAFLTRAPARAVIPGILPRVAAHGGTFLVVAFIAASSAWAPHWLARTPAPTAWRTAAVALLSLLGTALSCWGLWHLRASISLEPAARRLVTRGPYAHLRHPLYGAYLFSYSAIFLAAPTGPLAVVLALWFGCILLRIRYEERVLEHAFPEYAFYRERVGAFGPRLPRVLRTPLAIAVVTLLTAAGATWALRTIEVTANSPTHGG